MYAAPLRGLAGGVVVGSAAERLTLPPHAMVDLSETAISISVTTVSDGDGVVVFFSIKKTHLVLPFLLSPIHLYRRNSGERDLLRHLPAH